MHLYVTEVGVLPPVFSLRDSVSFGRRSHVPPGESLLLCALLDDSAPLTQHLGFLDLLQLSSHDSARRRAILNAPPLQARAKMCIGITIQSP